MVMTLRKGCGLIKVRHLYSEHNLCLKCFRRDDARYIYLNFLESVVYEKTQAALLNSNLKRGISQASPLSQTSCLEGFHSVLNHFSPKMISYSFAGMYCRYASKLRPNEKINNLYFDFYLSRHILAVLHFNDNLRRDEVIVKDKKQVKVVYPKFKNGEATVRSVRVHQIFGEI